MERHRAALADAAIGEQLEVQTAFREQGSLLQGIYDRKQRAEYDLSRKCVRACVEGSTVLLCWLVVFLVGGGCPVSSGM
jgi:hypothetical protein